MKNNNINNRSSFLIINYCFLLFLVFRSIPQGQASRRLLEDTNCPSGQAPSPTPVNKVTYKSETRNGAHAGLVCVNGEPRSQSGTVHDKDDNPVIVGANHTGSSTGYINDPSGKPKILATNTTDYQTAIINGSDGKPRFEVHKYSNGTAIIYVLGDDGKPLYNINYLPPPEGEGSGITAPGGYSFTPQMLEDPPSPPGSPN
ncbi:hypothetical protein JCGZ_18258 [Jatropha curcas]|uniref:Uncharacterized protein n=1 Tax=Jatropha curcas TaxID=180498 RepID=A0A067JZN5_JATCU|nr:hypothetical protein JCGZ_18258 [Jatropha curcas]